MNKKTNVIIGGLLVSLGIVLGVLGAVLSDNFIFHEDNITTTTTEEKVDETLEEYLLRLIREKSYYYQNEALLLEGALTGIVESLEDPYSTYFSEEAYEEYQQYLNKKLYGIGVSIVINGSYPLIVHVYDESPALSAGFKEGQTIKTVDGVDIKDMDVPEIADLIKGEKGTKRIIGVFTTNPENVTNITVFTDLVVFKTVTYDYHNINNNKIGYIKIDSFAHQTYDELVVAMKHLESKNIGDLIIDVRDNPGGLLTSVKEVLDYFINTDRPFMYSESKDKEVIEYNLDENDHEINYSIIVLMNENSASAAEVFSAAMNEIGNYQLIGKTTFGKGTMQNSYPINKDQTKVVKLTTDIWLTPNREWIHGVGFPPTIVVDQELYNGISYIDSYYEISYDHVNEEIKDVQIFLNRKGFTTRNDGYFDDDTRNSVLAYQAMKSLDQTGIVDFETAHQMNLDIMDYLINKDYDNQYQEALNYILNE